MLRGWVCKVPSRLVRRVESKRCATTRRGGLVHHRPMGNKIELIASVRHPEL